MSDEPRQGADVATRSDPLDFDQPNQARLTDALLGGRDNYAVDRAMAERLLDLDPGARQMARDHRDWVVRVLRMLVMDHHVEQFIDLGSGLPTVDNTHQVVQRYDPQARVIYVDDDPVVQAYGRALLEENDHTHMAGCDFTEPRRALAAPEFTRHLDPERPTALMMCAIVHHVVDDTKAAAVVRGWLDVLPPGSFLLLTHNYDPADGGEHSALARRVDGIFRGTALEGVHRTRARIASFFEGLDLIHPGLTYLHEWWPDGPRLRPLSGLNHTMLGGVARKP